LLTNDGTIAFDGSSAQFTGAGALQNDGILAVSASSGPTIDTALTGSGVLSIAAGSTLTLGAPVSASQTIDFEDNSGVLALTDPQDMQATIAGFVPGDRIQLGEVTVDAADYSASATGGTLTLFDGAQLIASLNFAGPHQLSDFVVSVATDSAPDGGAISTLTVLASTVVATGASAVGAELYRFFDTTNGTQLLTADPAERDAVMATRPDLKFEGAAMGAVAAPADDPAATPVYRFFDIADGTHFLTANEAEKNALLATRPDLVFEPSSTIWEDATQQPGDVPVFRFFDTATGTHFYTASAAERASILTTRSDFTAEGIAFYAPAQ
jgi:hypothetical protein